jgi:hypothetical protein
MNDELPMRFQRKNDEFAAPADRCDAIAHEKRREVSSFGPNDLRAKNLNRIESFSNHRDCETASDRFDFGEFRHVCAP